MKTYLGGAVYEGFGKAVYVEEEDGCAVLTDEDGIEVTARITLRPDACADLVRWFIRHNLT